MARLVLQPCTQVQLLTPTASWAAQVSFWHVASFLQKEWFKTWRWKLQWHWWPHRKMHTPPLWPPHIGGSNKREWIQGCRITGPSRMLNAWCLHSCKWKPKIYQDLGLLFVLLVPFAAVTCPHPLHTQQTLLFRAFDLFFSVISFTPR